MEMPTALKTNYIHMDFKNQALGTAFCQYGLTIPCVAQRYME